MYVKVSDFYLFVGFVLAIMFFAVYFTLNPVTPQSTAAPIEAAVDVPEVKIPTEESFDAFPAVNDTISYYQTPYTENNKGSEPFLYYGFNE